jgi:formate dehydrogenase subunit delta
VKQREHLVHMANQIAANFATMGDVDAAAATADHIASFWEPRMKRSVLEDASGLSPVASAAVALLRRNAEPASQTPATQFNAVEEAGRSDAG